MSTIKLFSYNKEKSSNAFANKIPNIKNNFGLLTVLFLYNCVA